MKVIDGSYGEGGGQILRSAVALSCITGEDIRVVNIRAKRPDPGLKHQHLTAIRAASEICGAEVEGLSIGSREVTFRPGNVSAGSFRFDVGTAGSVTLILQELLPVVAYSPGEVMLELIGGTDVPWSPPIDYLRYVMLPHLSRLGYEVKLRLIRRGHYPKGGGVVQALIPSPPKSFRPLRLLGRGEVREVRGVSHCVRLPKHVAERQARAAERALREGGIQVPIRIDLEYYRGGEDPHIGPGSGIVLWALAGDALIGSDSLGSRGRRAEAVGRDAGLKLLRELGTGAGLDTHMSDNILIYLALAEGDSAIHGSELSMHALTVMWLIRKFLPVSIDVSGEVGKPFKAFIKVRPHR